MLEVEPLLQLVNGEHLIFAPRRPAEQCQEVDQRLNEEALSPIVNQGGLALALTHLRSVWIQDQRQVGKLRERHTKRLEEEDVLRCIGEVVLAANHVGDPHVGIVNHHGEVIERRAICAQDHQVTTQCIAVDLHSPADKIFNNDHARLNTEAQCCRLASCDAGGRGLGGNSGTATGVARRELGRFTSLALCVEIAWGAEAGVGQPLGTQLIRDGGVSITAL